MCAEYFAKPERWIREAVGLKSLTSFIELDKVYLAKARTCIAKHVRCVMPRLSVSKLYIFFHGNHKNLYDL